jgi:hypothetical protein
VVVKVVIQTPMALAAVLAAVLAMVALRKQAELETLQVLHLRREQTADSMDQTFYLTLAVAAARA